MEPYNHTIDIRLLQFYKGTTAFSWYLFIDFGIQDAVINVAQVNKKQLDGAAAIYYLITVWNTNQLNQYFIQHWTYHICLPIKILSNKKVYVKNRDIKCETLNGQKNPSFFYSEVIQYTTVVFILWYLNKRWPRTVILCTHITPNNNFDYNRMLKDFP